MTSFGLRTQIISAINRVSWVPYLGASTPKIWLPKGGLKPDSFHFISFTADHGRLVDRYNEIVVHNNVLLDRHIGIVNHYSEIVDLYSEILHPCKGIVDRYNGLVDR